jgi:hypothetical protein
MFPGKKRRRRLSKKWSRLVKISDIKPLNKPKELQSHYDWNGGWEKGFIAISLGCWACGIMDQVIEVPYT